MPGEDLTRWTIRLALTFYVISLYVQLIGRGQVRRMSLARAAWTCGFGLYVAHVTAAFHFFHGWSHSAAYAETARQTKEVFGWQWGGGLWFNHLFTAVWALDVAWWWFGMKSFRRRSRWISIGVHGFLAFMVWNATVVFESGPVRWCGLAAACGLAITYLKSRDGRNDQHG